MFNYLLPPYNVGIVQLLKVFVLLSVLLSMNVVSNEKPAMHQGENLVACVAILSPGDWCELISSEPSSWAIKDADLTPYSRGMNGQGSITEAWTGMAYDGQYFYLTGGGHGDYGGNEIYRYDAVNNVAIQLTPQSPLDFYHLREANYKGKEGVDFYCRVPDSRKVPVSTHTYDGIEYYGPTNELLVSVYGFTAVSCFTVDHNDSTQESNFQANIVPNMIAPEDQGGIYALNLDTLKWRKIYSPEDYAREIVIRMEIRGTDNMLFFGNRGRLRYGFVPPEGEQIAVLGVTPTLPSAGDGVLVWDKVRNKFWSEHATILWGLDNNANFSSRHNEPPPKQDWRSLVIDESNNQLVKWDGAHKLQIFTPETNTFCIEDNPNGRPQYDPSASVAKWAARQIQLRVYTKFKYIKEHDVFIGVNEFDKPFLVHKRSHDCKVGRKIEHLLKKSETLAARVRRSQGAGPIERKLIDKFMDKKVDNVDRNQQFSAYNDKSALPLGNVRLLQKIGLLPEYGLANHVVNPDFDIAWHGGAGERDEIGLFPEQHAAFIAGQTDLKDSILQVALAPPPDIMDYAHHPNEFWLPFLLTGDKTYVANLEKVYKQYKNWRKQSPDSYIHYLEGREGAWNLRDLVQLAYLQGKGLTTETYYIDALNATRDRWLGFINNPDKPIRNTFNLLDFRIGSAIAYGWTGWMESMLGEAVNYTALITKDTKWKEIAAFHFKHLLKSTGEKWPLKAIGYDHILFSTYMPEEDRNNWPKVDAFSKTTDWTIIQPYHPQVMAGDYASLPDDDIPPLSAKAWSYPLTYTNRAQDAYAWAALACKNGIDNSCSKAKQIYEKITNRGDVWGYKYGVLGAHK